MAFIGASQELQLAPTKGGAASLALRSQVGFAEPDFALLISALGTSSTLSTTTDRGESEYSDADSFYSVQALPTPPLSPSTSSYSKLSTPATEKESESPAFEETKSTRHAKALIVEHPTLVSFVPTHEIQTAVSITADRIVIDTIFPPTATHPKNYHKELPHLASSHSPSASAPVATSPGRGSTATEALSQHEEGLIASLLNHKLDERYDPTGTIRSDIRTTLTGLTHFPAPFGAKDSCPCICCVMGCSAVASAPAPPSTHFAVSRSAHASMPDLTRSKSTRFALSNLFKKRQRVVDARTEASPQPKPRRASLDHHMSSHAGGPSDAAPALPVPESLPITQALVESRDVNRSNSTSCIAARRRTKDLRRRVPDTQQPPALLNRSSSQPDLLNKQLPLPPPPPPPRKSSKTYAITLRKSLSSNRPRRLVERIVEEHDEDQE